MTLSEAVSKIRNKEFPRVIVVQDESGVGVDVLRTELENSESWVVSTHDDVADVSELVPFLRQRLLFDARELLIVTGTIVPTRAFVRAAAKVPKLVLWSAAVNSMSGIRSVQDDLVWLIKLDTTQRGWSSTITDIAGLLGVQVDVSVVESLKKRRVSLETVYNGIRKAAMVSDVITEVEVAKYFDASTSCPSLLSFAEALYSRSSDAIIRQAWNGYEAHGVHVVAGWSRACSIVLLTSMTMAASGSGPKEIADVLPEYPRNVVLQAVSAAEDKKFSASEGIASVFRVCRVASCKDTTIENLIVALVDVFARG